MVSLYLTVPFRIQIEHNLRNHYKKYRVVCDICLGILLFLMTSFYKLSNVLQYNLQ